MPPSFSGFAQRRALFVESENAVCDIQPGGASPWVALGFSPVADEMILKPAHDHQAGKRNTDGPAN
jgi:hypothetical protein